MLKKTVRAKILIKVDGKYDRVSECQHIPARTDDQARRGMNARLKLKYPGQLVDPADWPKGLTEADLVHGGKPVWLNEEGSPKDNEWEIS